MTRTAYDRDGITIIEGDCADVLPNIDPATVGLLLTDPPYGIDHNTLYDDNRFPHNRGGTLRMAPIAGDDKPFDPTPLLSFPHLVLFGANNYMNRLPLSGRWLVWLKVAWGSSGGGLFSDAEMAWHNCGGVPPVLGFQHTWVGFARASEQNAHLHPTQKPAALMRWIVELFTQPGDLVVDPYMGSGPIAQACLETGRRYLGVEIDPHYVQTTIEHRLSQPTLFSQTP
jgi:site-specific DNA-methyltransferase (adenine-specific)